MKPHRLKNTYFEFLIVLPALIFYMVFVIYPLFGGIYYSFTDWNGVDANFNLIGLKNYFTLAQDKYVIGPLTNTFIYAFLSMILLNVLGLALAVGLDRIAKGKNLFRALFFVLRY